MRFPVVAGRWGTASHGPVGESGRATAAAAGPAAAVAGAADGEAAGAAAEDTPVADAAGDASQAERPTAAGSRCAVHPCCCALPPRVGARWGWSRA